MNAQDTHVRPECERALLVLIHRQLEQYIVAVLRHDAGAVHQHALSHDALVERWNELCPDDPLEPFQYHQHVRADASERRTDAALRPHGTAP